MTASSTIGDQDLAAARIAGRGAIVLKSSEFRRGREAGWRELEKLVAQVERRGVRLLSLHELQRLPILYRAALSSLSVARSIALDRNLLVYLENLALRAYLVVYGPRLSPREGLRNFFWLDLPTAVRAARWHILISALALLVGAVAGFALTVQDEAWYGSLVPSALAQERGISSTRADLHDKELFAPPRSVIESFGVFASFLFDHNTWVGIMTFGLGLAAGVPTLMLNVYQGLVLGAFLALHYDRGLMVDCLGWLSIHGTSELGALILLAAGGLVIADKVLFPGTYGRLDNLARHGRQAGQIAVGAVLMLFVAAILEGGFRQLVASTPLRFAIGGTMAALWIAYFTLCGRSVGSRSGKP